MNPRTIIRLSLLGLAVFAPAAAQVAIQPETAAVTQEQSRMEASQTDIAPAAETPAPALILPFGSHLFKGDFASLSYTGFNPEYRIAIGDQINVTLWGTTQTSLKLTVDAQGNVFMPEIGPITVAGVRNADLNQMITARVGQIYIKGVQVYAHLVSAQSVKVFVTGYVKKPGLYGGSSSDIMLYFLAKAGGIDPDRGSYIDISLIRGGETVETINLYDFIARGRAHSNQFRDGDTLLVNPRRNVTQLNGEALNTNRFEFKADSIPLTEILSLARPLAQATHVSILRSAEGHTNAEVHPIGNIKDIVITPDDLVTLLRRTRPQTILVSVVGEQDDAIRLVLPYGATLGDAITQMRPIARSNIESLQLFRKSVAERQKALLNNALDNLARNVTSTPSDSLEEAQLRQVETQTILSFIERARKVEPKGQVLLGPRPESDRVHLENGDILYIPANTNLINTFGEVRFPNTQSYQKKFRVKDYIKEAGGYTDTADTENIIVLKTDGRTVNLELIGKSARSYRPDPGDEIIILPEPDTKNLQFAKDITGIVYQLAIGARVVLDP